MEMCVRKMENSSKAELRTFLSLHNLDAFSGYTAESIYFATVKASGHT